MEVIVPLIFLVVWGLAKMFGGNKEQKEGEPSSSSPPVEVDRTREIQEEIRRRIAERKQSQQSAPAQTQAPRQLQPQPQTGQTTLHPTTADQTQPSPFQQSIPKHHYAAQEPTGSEVNMEEQLQEQLRKIQEAQSQAKRIRRIEARGRSRKSSGKQKGIRAEVLDSLQDPRGPRKAIIYMEVLGAPVSVRQDSGFLHFWEQK